MKRCVSVLVLIMSAGLLSGCIAAAVGAGAAGGVYLDKNYKVEKKDGSSTSSDSSSGSSESSSKS